MIIEKAEYVFNKQAGLVSNFLKSELFPALGIGVASDLAIGTVADQKNNPGKNISDSMKDQALTSLAIGGGAGALIHFGTPAISKFMKKVIK